MSAAQAKNAVDNIINVNGIVNVASATVKGGKIILDGGNKGQVRVNNKLDASGNGGGEIDIAGQNIRGTTNAEITADGGETGNGGNVSIVAINENRFLGKATAKGGSTSGDGGRVEVSGASGRIKADLDASATSGANGMIYIDPANVCITSGPACANVGAGDTLSLDVNTVINALNGGSDFTVETGDIGNTNGDIEVRDDISTNTSSLATLSLLAHDDVIISDTIADAGAGLSVVMVAGKEAGQLSHADVRIRDNITTNGGNFTATADNDVEVDANVDTGGGHFTATGHDDVVVNAAITTDGGNVTLNATDTFGGDLSEVEITSAGSINTTNGNLVLNAEDLDVHAASTINAGTGSISIYRSTEGDIGLGDNVQEMHITQAEIDTMTADTLTIGRADLTANNVKEIKIENIDTTSAINGNVELNTAAGNDADIEFLAGNNTFASLTANAGDDVIIRGAAGTSVTTTKGDIIFNADADRDLSTGNSNQIEITTSNVTITSAGDITFIGDDYLDDHLSTSINANGGTGTVNILRSNDGTIGLGDGAGDMQLAQGELNNITAAKMVFGNADAGQSNTTDINVGTVNLSHVTDVDLNAKAGTPSTINFNGPSIFTNLDATADEIDVNAQVTATTIDFNTPLVNLDANLESATINGTATTVNVLGSVGGADIQDAVDLSASGATVNVAAGTYIENIIIDKKLDLIGTGATVQAATPGNALITVTASDVTIDPFIFDGLNAVDYGIHADGLGAIGLTVDGNTFRNFKKAGMFVKNTVAPGTTAITNNIFEGSSKLGVEVGKMTDATLNITGNTMGTAGDLIKRGINMKGKLDNTIVNITGNAIEAKKVGIAANNTQLTNGTAINITNNTKITSRDEDAIRIKDKTEGGVSLTISDNTGIAAVDDGIDVADIAGAQITDNTFTNTGDAGIELNNTDDVDVLDNTINNADTAIRLANSTTATIEDNEINTSNNGVAVTDSATVTIRDNDFEGNGIGTGISVTNTTDAIIGGIVAKGNDVDDFDIGIAVTNSDNAQISHNGINKEANTHDASVGIQVTGGTSVDVDYNKIDDTTIAGIQATDTVRVDIDDNDITDTHDGIKVTGGKGSDIRRNEIDGASDDGIDVENHKKAEIQENIITDVADAGIVVRRNSHEAIIALNDIEDAKDGIRVKGSDTVTVEENTVTDATRDGIHTQNSDELIIVDNTVTGSGDNGIYVETAQGAIIAGNTTTGNDDDGIDVNTSQGILIIGNKANGNGDDGIDIDGSQYVIAFDNKAKNNTGDGIELDGTKDALIIGNTLKKNNDNGLYMNNSRRILVAGNTIKNNKDDGVDIDNSRKVLVAINDITKNDDDGVDIGNDSRQVTLFDNTIKNNDDNGVQITGSRNILIDDNTISKNDNNGVYASGSNNIRIKNSRIKKNGNDGIYANEGSKLRIKKNTITGNSDEGIDIERSDDIVISKNTVNKNSSDGIEIERSENITVSDNTVNKNGTEGIEIVRGTGFTVSGNTVKGNDVGISIRRSEDGTLSKNTVKNSLTTGIEVARSSGIDILENTITASGEVGFHAKGAHNGSITLAGNTLTDNPLGALFESGAIDLTGAANTFENGITGMRFSPAGDPANLTLVGNTFGTTIFEGQSGNYIEFENAAFFDPGTPTVLDAVNVSFDGTIPNSFPKDLNGNPIVPQDVLDAIEGKLQDFDDLGTVGQIFVGNALTIDNFEDFLRGFNPFNVDPNAVNVTLLGLPPVSLDASAFANIAPAAGNGEEGSESDLASIEPAAGGAQANCWGDAVSSSTAQATSFTFGGTFEETIAIEAAGCGVTDDNL